MKRVWLILVAMLGLAASAVPASAALVYSLNCTNSSCSTTSTTYGTVTLADPVSGKIKVTVQLNGDWRFGNDDSGSNGGYAIAWSITGAPDLTTTILTGAGNTPNPTRFTIQNDSGSSRYRSSPFTNNSCGGANAPSCFFYAIDYDSDSNDSKLVFDITKSGGLTLADFAGNSNSFMFAANIRDKDDAGDGNEFNVAARGIPEPLTMSLFGAGLLGAAVLRRRKLARV